LVYYFGISQLFWDTVIIPIYSSSFLTVHISYVPAVIVPILNDLIPVDTVPVMESWRTNSGEVFQKMTKNIMVNLEDPVISVQRIRDKEIIITTKKGRKEKYNYVIFACSADSIIKCLQSPSILEYILLYWVGYADDHDKSFMEGIIHSDSSVLPELNRDDILRRYSNYIEISRNPTTGKLSVENNFILSSWIPVVSKYGGKFPMIITYNSDKAISKPAGKISNARLHPDLSFMNLGIGMLLRFCQGYQNTYYCGSYSTPGNGHDLSLLSGLVIACTLGAEYPFKNNDAKEDFRKLARIMGL